MKKTSQRSLLFRQNVNRTEEERVHFLDGYRQSLGNCGDMHRETVVKRSFGYSEDFAGRDSLGIEIPEGYRLTFEN